MKIKTWLLVSYLIVMLLPLLSAYILFATYVSYNNDKQVEDYFYVMPEVKRLNNILEEPALYQQSDNHHLLAELAESSSLQFSFYTAEGKLIYSDNQAEPKQLPIDQLYQDLYQLNREFRTYEYKEPVFHEGQIIGFYIAEVERQQFIETMANRAWFVAGTFILSFLAIYIIVVFIIHLRINRRLDRLMLEMTAFAEGISLPESSYSKDEIGALKGHFYDMRNQVNDAQQMIAEEQQLKEQMVANISHDLKTPLTSIKAYAEAIGSNPHLTTSEKENYRQVIMEKADYMQQMISDLNTHTLLQSATYKMDTVTVDGEEFFDMLLSGYEPLCEEKKLVLHVNAAAEGEYDVSPKQFIRVVDNLMVNAIRHTPIGGNIWLMAISECAFEKGLFPFVSEQYTFDFDKYVYIIVQNEGEGIPKNHMHLLFDPLYQVDMARSKVEDHGTGLGLTITKQIMKRHGGYVHALSEENVGACFICVLPKKGVKR